MAGMNFTIRSKEDIIKAIEKFGFLPYFANSIEGFSIQEHIQPKYWFGSTEGAWEWKGPIIRETNCAYGKFFERKAVYVSREWFADLANYRRDGYDFDARFDDGLAPLRDKELFDLITANEPVLSKDLKHIGDYVKGGKKGFESVITKLQEQCYVLISDFVYERDSKGNAYGWGVAEYSTPEVFLGESFTQNVYKRSPHESYLRLKEHLASLLPQATEKQIERLLR